MGVGVIILLVIVLILLLIGIYCCWKRRRQTTSDAEIDGLIYLEQNEGPKPSTNANRRMSSHVLYADTPASFPEEGVPLAYPVATSVNTGPDNTL